MARPETQWSPRSGISTSVAPSLYIALEGDVPFVSSSRPLLDHAPVLFGCEELDATTASEASLGLSSGFSSEASVALFF